jgi:hypothetical protein
MAGRNRAGRRAAPRRGAGARLAAAATGGVLALSGVLVTGAGAAPAPAAVVAPAPAPADARAQEPAEPEPPTAAEPSAAPGPAVDPRAAAFREGLAAADVPTSETGEYEVLVAAEVCDELAAGADEEELAYRIPPVLPTVTPETAATLIDVAKDEYC